MNANKYSYFENHPNAKEFHFTSDGTAFHEDHHAHNHAKHLGDKKVEKHTRAEAEAWAEKQKAAKEPEQPKKQEEPLKHIVTEQDLINNPTLAEQGVTVGEEIELELLKPEEPKQPAKKAAPAKPAAAKKIATKKATSK